MGLCLPSKILNAAVFENDWYSSRIVVKMGQEANDMRSLPGDGVDKEAIAHGL